jgi:uncharacterized OB-fold protein
MSENLSTMMPGENIHITTDTCTIGFWNSAKAHKLTACQCADCGHFRMPPRPFCPECQSKNINWPELPGTATVYSFAVCHKSPTTGEDLLYIPVILDLDGAPGVRLTSNLVGINPENVKIGMQVKVAWHPITDGWVLPIFTPI